MCRRDAGAQLHVRGAVEHERSGQRYSAARRAWLRDSVSWNVAHGDGGATADKSARASKGMRERRAVSQSITSACGWSLAYTTAVLGSACNGGESTACWWLWCVVRCALRMFSLHNAVAACTGLHTSSRPALPLVRGPIFSLLFYKKVNVA